MGKKKKIITEKYIFMSKLYFQIYLISIHFDNKIVFFTSSIVHLIKSNIKKIFRKTITI